MKNIIRLLLILSICSVIILTCSEKAAEPQWISIFDGESLAGWTPKFAGHVLGENYLDTFQAKDGLLRVVYDGYEKFNNEFGHLFYKDKYSHYKIRCEYRFVGDQVAEGPEWAFRNNGLMLHCQDPQTMGLEQNFPVSIEVQLLGGNGVDERTTGNLCTPGTNVVLNGQLELQHCINSTSATYHGDQWVACEVEVHGGETMTHYINGEAVLSYEKPQYDQRDADAQKLIKDDNLIISEGYIAIQAESHPTEFRKIEILPLD